MSKKKTKVAKSGPVWHRSAEQATLERMPKFNAHACGTGPHGKAKYDRAKQKQLWQRESNAEGARFGGRLPFSRGRIRPARARGLARRIAASRQSRSQL